MGRKCPRRARRAESPTPTPRGARRPAARPRPLPALLGAPGVLQRPLCCSTCIRQMWQRDLCHLPAQGLGRPRFCRTLVTGDLQPWHLALSRPLHLSLQCPPPRLSPQPSPRPCSPGAPGPLPAASEVGWWLDMGSGGGMAHGDPVSSQLPGLSPATSQHHRGLCVSPDPCCLGRQSRKQ